MDNHFFVFTGYLPAYAHLFVGMVYEIDAVGKFTELKIIVSFIVI